MSNYHIRLSCMGALSVCAVVGLTGCPGVSEKACGNGFNRQSGAVGDFGETEAAMQVEAFLSAVGKLQKAANDLSAETEEACRAIGVELQMTEAELTAAIDSAPNATPTEVVCGNVATKLQEEYTFITGQSITLEVTVDPVVCEANLEVQANCYARCDANVDVEATPPRCDVEGELWVSCSAECSGSCRIPEVEAQCEGSCEGTCSGQCEGSCVTRCEGTCTGECNGICSNEAGGECRGTCDGTCNGECSTGCEGSCSGTCTGSCSAGCTFDVTEGGCEGECKGECSVPDAPTVRCEGGELNVEAEAECEAACDAEASFDAHCTPPQATVTITGSYDAEELRARVINFINAVELGFPGLARVAKKLAVVAQAIGPVVQTASDGLSGAVELGAQAGACVVMAADMSIQAQLSINVSVSASASVSSSVEAQ